jgi:bacteriocin biosynthesis cyclodehydratase domain-containing protein
LPNTGICAVQPDCTSHHYLLEKKMPKPRLKEYLDLVPMAGNRYQVRGPESLYVLTGQNTEEVLPHMLPLLDGNHSTEEIIEKLEEVAPAEVIEGVLQKLERFMIVEDASAKEGEGDLTPEQVEPYRNQMGFFAIVTEWGGEFVYQKNLMDSHISIIGDGDLAARIAIECARTGIGGIRGVNLNGNLPGVGAGSPDNLVTHGIDLRDIDSSKQTVAGDPPHLLVLALDRPDRRSLEFVNQLSQDLALPVLYAQINGTQGVVGPMVVPGKTACLSCYHLRVTRNLDFYGEYRLWEKWTEESNGKRYPAPSIGPFTSIVAGMAALEVVKRLSNFHEADLYGKFLTVNALTLECIPHQLLRIPRCPTCGKVPGQTVTTPWLEKR